MLAFSQWWTALSSALGCDPATSSTCATSVNENSTGWNDGLIYYDPSYASDGNQNLYLTKRFYVLGQYSKYVRPGAVRYGLSGSPSGVQTMAFWNNGQWTVVADNTSTSATTLGLNLGSGTLTSASGPVAPSGWWCHVAPPPVRTPLRTRGWRGSCRGAKPGYAGSSVPDCSAAM
jgi:hypothetical protein